MRVRIREVIDTDSPIDLSKLSPLQRIWVSLVVWYRDSKAYERRKHRKLEQEFKKKTLEEESLKETVLYKVFSELVQNKTLGEKGLVCSKVIIGIDRSKEEVLREILKHKEFIDYPIKILPCNQDLLKCYKNIPILLEVGKRFIESK